MTKRKLNPKRTGRPAHYKDAFAATTYNLRLLGFTDKQLAENFRVSVKTIDAWKKRHPDFRDAYYNAGAVADGEIAASLFKKAKGFREITEKVTKNGVAQVEEYHAPDTAAAGLWLANRQGWRSQKNQEAQQQGATQVQNIQVNVLSTLEQLANSPIGSAFLQRLMGPERTTVVRPTIENSNSPDTLSAPEQENSPKDDIE